MTLLVLGLLGLTWALAPFVPTLRELREIIYPQLKPERPAEASVPAGFEALPGESLTYTLELAGAAVIADLLTMTPHLYRASAEGRAKNRRVVLVISRNLEVRRSVSGVGSGKAQPDSALRHAGSAAGTQAADTGGTPAPAPATVNSPSPSP